MRHNGALAELEVNLRPRGWEIERPRGQLSVVVYSDSQRRVWTILKFVKRAVGDSNAPERLSGTSRQRCHEP